MEEAHLSLAEAAERLGISERSAYRWIKSGKLPAYKPGRDYWIPESAVRELIEQSKVQVRPKAPAPPSQASFNHLLAEERRVRPWIRYLSRRVEWREKIFQRKPGQEFHNPWLSLETAIQWAVDLAAESTDLQNTIKGEVLTADTVTDEADELRALLDRFKQIADRTDERVKAMMEDEGLGESQMKSRLRLIHGERGA